MPKLLSIIIPIYNEEEIIRTSLPEILTLDIDKEVIIVNDGSNDGTLDILKELNKKYQFILIDQKANYGKGAAVKTGLENITGEYFIVCDADLEYKPQDIIFLVQEIKKLRQDVSDKKIAIYGSRFLNKNHLSFHYSVNRFLTSLTNFLFGSRLTDMETCFKLIPTEALKDIELKGGRFEIEPEITAKLLKAGYQIIERPISYDRRSYAEGKKIKARDGLLAVKTLLVERLFSR